MMKNCDFCTNTGFKIVGHSIKLTDLVSHIRHSLRIVPFGEGDAFISGISVECVDCSKKLLQVTNNLKFCPMCGVDEKLST